MAEKTKFIGVGKRKRSVARVSLFSPGKGNIEINGINVDKYVPRESLATIIRQPLNILDKIKDYDISVNVKGGGLSGQAGAVRHGLSRALCLFEPDLRKPLKSAGMLTRDSRVVERKKYGRAKARKSFQFSKR